MEEYLLKYRCISIEGLLPTRNCMGARLLSSVEETVERSVESDEMFVCDNYLTATPLGNESGESERKSLQETGRNRLHVCL